MLAAMLALYVVQASAQAFTYHKIFSPEQIPPTGGATVSAIYSPSVVKVNGRYLMFFGVSLSCRNGTVARDSIAYAASYDGVSNWQWIGYIIEPNTTVCLLDTAQWLPGALYQVNDPTVRVTNGQIHVAYTTVFWKYPVPGVECGAIGTAVFNAAQFPLQAPTYRNNTYLVPTAIQCQQGGFSRPVYVATPTGHDIWVDSFGTKVSRIPVTSNTQLAPSNVVHIPGLSAVADIDVFSKGGCIRLLSNAAGGLNQQKYINGSWTAKTKLTQPSGQVWDSWQHGSANYYKDGDVEQVYMSGAVSNDAGWYASLNIGVAIPRTPTSFGDCN
jgi:hypothetical protein